MGHHDMSLSGETWFRLSSTGGSDGIACNEKGAFVGGIPLLQRAPKRDKSVCWEPRALDDLNNELTKRFGLPVDFAGNMSGLGGIARALDRGDLVRAQVATLLLGIPDPPDLAKSSHSITEVLETARRLKASGILKADWDPSKHPRWPAGSPGGVGGEFSPAASGSGSSSPSSNPAVRAGDNRSTFPSPSLIPAEIAIPLPPFDIPAPGELSRPLPFEILPPPLAIPNANPRDRPKIPIPGGGNA